MKKYLQYLIVFILIVTIVGIAQSNSVWASPQLSDQSRPDSEITVTDDGEYTVGGICNFNVTYKSENLSNKAAVDVPAKVSREVPFSYPDHLYLSGCHITHIKDNKVKQEMTSEEGDWEVCFGDRPDEKLTIYYYPDDLAAVGKAVWLPLPTVKKDTYVCTPAIYTGVYAPGGLVFIPNTGDTEGDITQPETVTAGTVQVTIPASETITESGTYGAGGICQLTVDYYVPKLSNELHVERNIEISANVPFPDNEGLLYLPGCHVFHYKESQLIPDVTAKEGKWEICFAAVPNKQTTIYFYRADGDSENVLSSWDPLETQAEGGTACAELTNYTGVYAPVGK